MLNHNVASSECFSSFAQNMRCAMYPPPPGSAPGYQVAHQFIEMYTRNVIIGIHAELRSGTKLSAEPAVPVASPLARSMAASCCFIESIPPTAWIAATASTITMVILMTNWNRSVTRTPQSPDNVETNDVSAMIPTTMASAQSLFTPKMSDRILTIARFTQPRMMQLMGIPR